MQIHGRYGSTDPMQAGWSYCPWRCSPGSRQMRSKQPENSLCLLSTRCWPEAISRRSSLRRGTHGMCGLPKTLFMHTAHSLLRLLAEEVSKDCGDCGVQFHRDALPRLDGAIERAR